MKTGIITEIVDFLIVEGVTDDCFKEIVNSLENNFHSKQKGFIDTELLKGREPNRWIMIQHWDSIEDVKASSNLMMKSECTEEFRKALIPSTVKMSITEQAGVWR